MEVNGLGTGQTVPLKANRGDTGKVHTPGSSCWSPGLSRSAGAGPLDSLSAQGGSARRGSPDKTTEKTGRPAVRGEWNGASRDAPVVTCLSGSGKRRSPGSMSI